jgi:hypothetical protein
MENVVAAMADMERGLVDGTCPADLRQPVELVISACRDLKLQLDVLGNLNRGRSRRRSRIGSQDTAIL